MSFVQIKGFKINVQLKPQDSQRETMQEIFKILNLVRDFDLRDNPNDEIYSLI